jgi:hypothetical protein
MNFLSLGAAVFFIPAGMWVVAKSKIIGRNIRVKMDDSDEARRNREDNLPENDYVKNAEAMAAGVGFLVFLSGLVMIVIGMGVVK